MTKKTQLEERNFNFFTYVLFAVTHFCKEQNLQFFSKKYFLNRNHGQNCLKKLFPFSSWNKEKQDWKRVSDLNRKFKCFLCKFYKVNYRMKAREKKFKEFRLILICCKIKFKVSWKWLNHFLTSLNLYKYGAMVLKLSKKQLHHI